MGASRKERAMAVILLVLFAMLGLVMRGVHPAIPDMDVQMAFWPLVGSLAASFLGGLFGGTTQSRTSTTRSTTTPTLDPALRPLQSQLINMFSNRLRSGYTLPPGYEAGNIRTINDTYRAAGLNTENNLVSRGLSRSPIAGVLAGNRNLARAGEISRMSASLPLIERELQTQDMMNAMGLLNYGRGSTSTGTTTGEGGALSGGIGDLASMLGWLYGNGAFGGRGGWFTNAPGQNTAEG